MVIPLTTQHYPMLQRNLLYTPVTRGKRLVVILPEESYGDRGKEEADWAEVVEAAGVADPTLEFRSVADKSANHRRARWRTWMEAAVWD